MKAMIPLCVISLLAAAPCRGAEPGAVRLAGTPAEIGRAFGAINKKLIAEELDTTFVATAAAKGISRAVLIERAGAFVKIANKIAPHWLEEARATAEAAGVDADLYVAFLGTRVRNLFLHECTSYAVYRDFTRGGAIFFHKNRDNKDLPQAAYLVASSLPGINKFIAVGDASRIACSMVVNDKGLAGSADYPAHLTRKNDPTALVPDAAAPQYRGMMAGAMLRYIAEKSTTCADALSVIQDFVKKGYYAGGDVNGQHWLFVDRQGTILEVSSNAQHVVSRVHAKKAYFSRRDDSRAALRLAEAQGPIDFHLFHNVSRDPSICLKSSISGMTAEIDPAHPELFTCAWISLPARVVSFPVLMGQSSTPACLVSGEAYALGKRATDAGPSWEDAERAAHASKEQLRRKLLAGGGPASAAEAARALDAWTRQQAAGVMRLLQTR